MLAMHEVSDKRMMGLAPVSVIFLLLHKLDTKFAEGFCLNQVMKTHVSTIECQGLNFKGCVNID